MLTYKFWRKYRPLDILAKIENTIEEWSDRLKDKNIDPDEKEKRERVKRLTKILIGGIIPSFIVGVVVTALFTFPSIVLSIAEFILLFYVGRIFYKYIIASFFENLRLSRQRAVVAKLLIHKYYLRDYNLLQFIPLMYNIKNVKHQKDFDRESIIETLNEEIELIPFKCYLYITKKALSSITWGLILFFGGIFAYLVINLSLQTAPLNDIIFGLGDMETTASLSIWVLIVFFYFSIQFLFQGLTWLRPWFLNLRKLKEEDESIILFVNYQLFRDKMDLNIKQVIAITNDYSNSTTDLKNFINSK